MKIRIGSRGSNLALWQARWVGEELRKLHVASEIVVIKTTGDVRQDRFSAIQTKGMFIKEIEETLLRREIDLAVHSLKDVPTTLAENLTLAAVPQREDPSDVLIAGQRVASIADLPNNARVGTSSPRRVSQLRGLRPDVQAVEIRGNVETRIKKVASGEVDAVILAFPGVHRLGLDDHISARLAPEEMLPAPGQGALALETHLENRELNAVLVRLDDPATRSTTGAERLLLEKLGGGCRLPLGAFAHWEGQKLILQAVVARPDGFEILRGEVSGSSADEVAEEMVSFLASEGALQWLTLFAQG